MFCEAEFQVWSQGALQGLCITSHIDMNMYIAERDHDPLPAPHPRVRYTAPVDLPNFYILGKTPLSR